MKKCIGQYFLIFASLILLGLAIYSGYSENNYNYAGMLSNVLLIVAMILSIREQHKNRS